MLAEPPLTDRVAEIWKTIIYIGLLVASITISIAVVHSLNFYHGELDVYLPHFLGDMTFPEKVFSPIAELDLTGTSFRAREIGSLFNYLDTQAAVLLIKIGYPSIISPLYYACVIVIAALAIATQKKILSESYDKTRSRLLILLFITATPILFGGAFYRTNKIVASLFAAVCFAAYLFLNKPGLRRRVEFYALMAMFVAAVFAGLSDEQGMALIGMLTGYSIIRSIIAKQLSGPTLTLLASIAFLWIYRNHLGPFLFLTINEVAVTTTVKNSTIPLDPHHLYNSAKLLGRYVSYFFGNSLESSMASAGIFFVAAKVATIKGKEKEAAKSILPAFIYLFTGLIVIVYLMTLQHPAIFWKDIISYYPVPIFVAAFFALIVAIHEVKVVGALDESAIHKVLKTFIALNLLAIPGSYKIVTNGHMSVFRHADEIVIGAKNSRLAPSILEAINIPGETHGKKEATTYGEAGIAAIRGALSK